LLVSTTKCLPLLALATSTQIELFLFDLSPKVGKESKAGVLVAKKLPKASLTNFAKANTALECKF
jgi:hypothetical protein